MSATHKIFRLHLATLTRKFLGEEFFSVPINTIIFFDGGRGQLDVDVDTNTEMSTIHYIGHYSEDGGSIELPDGSEIWDGKEEKWRPLQRWPEQR